MSLTNEQKRELTKALAVACEMTGTELSQPTAEVMLADLAAYPFEQVVGALRKCRRELRGRLSLAAIIERLDDGRPSANEAWAMIPKDEHGSVVWTAEMQDAYGVAYPLLYDGQEIAARMAFLSVYDDRVAKARDAGVPVRWQPSLGRDVAGREDALATAVRRARITQEHAARLCCTPLAGDSVAALTGPNSPLADADKARMRALSFGSGRGRLQ